MSWQINAKPCAQNQYSGTSLGEIHMWNIFFMADLAAVNRPQNLHCVKFGFAVDLSLCIVM